METKTWKATRVHIIIIIHSLTKKFMAPPQTLGQSMRKLSRPCIGTSKISSCECPEKCLLKWCHSFCCQINNIVRAKPNSTRQGLPSVAGSRNASMSMLPPNLRVMENGGSTGCQKLLQKQRELHLTKGGRSSWENTLWLCIATYLWDHICLPRSLFMHKSFHMLPRNFFHVEVAMFTVIELWKDKTWSSMRWATCCFNLHGRWFFLRLTLLYACVGVALSYGGNPNQNSFPFLFCLLCALRSLS
jgi:hypothetical protein